MKKDSPDGLSFFIHQEILPKSPGEKTTGQDPFLFLYIVADILQKAFVGRALM